MILHQGIYSKGMLLEEVTMPLDVGEVITLTPRLEAEHYLGALGVSGHSLRIVGVGNVHVAGVTFEGPQATLPVRALGPAHPGHNTSEWAPPQSLEVAWTSPVRPGLHIEWTASALVSLNTYQHPYKDGRWAHLDKPGAVRVPPDMLPPVVHIQWWANPIEGER